MAQPTRSRTAPRTSGRAPSGSASRNRFGGPSGRDRGEPLVTDGWASKLRPLLPVVAVVAGIGIFVYAIFFGATEEEKVRARLAELATAIEVKETESNLLLRAARLNEAFGELFVKEVTIQIPELTGAISGRRELAAAATQAAGLWRTATVDVGGLAVEVDEPETSALATGNVTLHGTRASGEAEIDTREVSIRLDKVDGDWRIVSLAVSAKGDSAF